VSIRHRYTLPVRGFEIKIAVQQAVLTFTDVQIKMWPTQPTFDDMFAPCAPKRRQSQPPPFTILPFSVFAFRRNHAFSFPDLRGADYLLTPALIMAPLPGLAGTFCAKFSITS
jgi:hypothetical protein